MCKYLFSKTVILISALMLLGACVSSGGYSNPWKINSKNSATAQQAPSTLADPNIWAEQNNGQTDNGEMILSANGQQKPAGSEYYSPYRGNVDYGADGYTNNLQMDNSLYGMPPSPAASVRVALLAPMSGQAAHLGKAFVNASQMALFDLKMADFEVAPYDTKSTPQGAEEAARQAISDGASLIIGPLFADSVRRARAVASRHNVSVLGFSTDWTTASSNSYVMGFMPFTQVQRIVQHAAQKGYHRIGVIAPDDVYGQAVVNTYLEEATRYGLDTVSILRYTAGQDDISLRMREFSQYDSRRDEKGELFERYELPFDAVLMAVGSEQAIAISNLLTFHDLDPRRVKRLGTGLWDDPALAGEDNLRGAVFAAPSPNLRQSFVSRYKMLYNAEPPRLASLAYDATALSIVLAKHGLGQNGVPAFGRDYLTNPNGFSGVDGIFRFHSNGLIERGLAVLELDRGRIKVIEDAPSTFMRPRM
ncbi:MAG: penicillin-binding protein activator [Pseudomonadota bacterium]|nr:penicillin-binding protein activator [Pseudomonadota bacterium]MED5422835.1 penicillin-binding protein activator [Pseudomonadota bacterium]